MALILIKCPLEHGPDHPHHMPVYVDPVDVCAVVGQINGPTIVLTRNCGPVCVNIPADAVVECLFPGFNATKH